VDSEVLFEAPKFYSITAEISPLSLSSTFRIKSLGLDRRYHIVMELDPAKQLTLNHTAGRRMRQKVLIDDSSSSNIRSSSAQDPRAQARMQQ
jgi:hypothetical protein